MEPHRLVVGLADGDDRGEVAVLPVREVRLRPVRPLDPRLDLSVVEKELLDPSGGGGLFPGEGLMLIVDDKYAATKLPPSTSNSPFALLTWPRGSTEMISGAPPTSISLLLRVRKSCICSCPPSFALFAVCNAVSGRYNGTFPATP